MAFMLGGTMIARVGKFPVQMRNDECGQKYKRCLMNETWETKLEKHFALLWAKKRLSSPLFLK